MPLLYACNHLLSPLQWPSLSIAPTKQLITPLCPPSKTQNPINSKLKITTIQDPTSSRTQQQSPLAICFPSLSLANIYYSKPGFNFQIMVSEDEPEEVLIRRFRRESRRSGVLLESRRRRFFENPRDKKKRKAREAAYRNRRRRFVPEVAKGAKEKKKKKVQDDDDDNWELPEGELLY